MKTIQLPKKVLEDLPEIKDQIKSLIYLRDGKRKPFGILLITNDDLVGWSLCNDKDQWDKVFGIKKAYYRTKAGENIKWVSAYLREDMRKKWKTKMRNLAYAFFFITENKEVIEEYQKENYELLKEENKIFK